MYIEYYLFLVPDTVCNNLIHYRVKRWIFGTNGLMNRDMLGIVDFLKTIIHQA